jgi:hypothetical protein
LPERVPPEPETRRGTTTTAATPRTMSSTNAPARSHTAGSAGLPGGTSPTPGPGTGSVAAVGAAGQADASAGAGKGVAVASGQPEAGAGEGVSAASGQPGAGAGEGGAGGGAGVPGQPEVGAGGGVAGAGGQAEVGAGAGIAARAPRSAGGRRAAQIPQDGIVSSFCSAQFRHVHMCASFRPVSIRGHRPGFYRPRTIPTVPELAGTGSAVRCGWSSEGDTFPTFDGMGPGGGPHNAKSSVRGMSRESGRSISSPRVIGAPNNHASGGPIP